MEDIVVTKEGVTKLLKGLNPSKALGPDELHPRVLKELATELGPLFAHLFKQSLVRSPRSGHLQTLVSCSKRATDHLLAIPSRFLDLCTLQVTGTHIMLKHHDPP